MNKQNHIDLAPVGQRTQDLINGRIDGEISVTEQAELDRLLVTSKDARKLNEDLRTLTRVLDELPDIEPPQFLQSAIERQVRVPVQGNLDSNKPVFLGGLLNANWLRTSLALAAGVVLTFGVYEMGSEPITTRDTATMTGTVLKNGFSGQNGSLLDSIDLNTEKLKGLIELRNKDDLFTLDVKLSSDGPSEVVVNFAGRGLEFDGKTPMQNPAVTVSVRDGSIHLASQGEQHYTVMLRRTSQAGQAAPLELDFFADNELIQKAELIISQY